MTRRSFTTVTSYIESVPPDSARVLRKILALVKRTVPGAREVISYNIPAFATDKPFMYCAAFKAHIGIYPPVRSDARLMKAVAPYSNDKGNLRFLLDEPIPYALIARIAKALAKQQVAKAKRNVR
jgi:uncharacterized protein YdhG (YjbR/CyaY superfamily)